MAITLLELASGVVSLELAEPRVGPLPDLHLACRRGLLRWLGEALAAAPGKAAMTALRGHRIVEDCRKLYRGR